MAAANEAERTPEDRARISASLILHRMVRVSRRRRNAAHAEMKTAGEEALVDHVLPARHAHQGRGKECDEHFLAVAFGDDLRLRQGERAPGLDDAARRMRSPSAGATRLILNSVVSTPASSGI